MNTTSTDRIEKHVILKAPQTRVWRAIADAEQFGAWFRMKFEAPFVEGKTLRGRILYPGYEHITGEFQIVRIEPERYFAYRWHPYAVDMPYPVGTEKNSVGRCASIVANTCAGVGGPGQRMLVPPTASGKYNALPRP